MRESYQVRVHLIEARSLRGENESKGFAVSAIGKVNISAGEGQGLVDESKYTTKGQDSNSVFWNQVLIFQCQLSREAFNQGKIDVAVEDAGFFSNTLVGSAQFDLVTVYDYPAHEIFGEWCALMDASKGSAVQGFLRLSITVLREGDVPKIHTAKDLDAGEEPDIGLVMGMPEIETEGFLLVVVINKVEIAEYGLDKPTIQVRMRFGATEVKTKVCRRGYEATINDKLRIPVYRPTLTDRINIEVLDTSASNPITGAEKVVCRCTLSCRAVMRDMLVTHWENMYGVRPLPKTSLIGGIGRQEDESAEDTAYRGRMMLFASCEKPKPDESLQVMRLPLIVSKQALDAGSPKEENYALRCDLYDGADIPCGALESVYVVVALGPYERRSTACAVTDGVVRFESDSPGKEGYYEQLEELRASMPEEFAQHYDIYVHVYIEGPFGSRRIGYKRFPTQPFMRDIEDGIIPTETVVPTWHLLLPDPVYREELEVVTAMLQFSLVFGPQKIVDGIPRKRMRIPKLKHYELTARIYQAQGLVPSDDNGLADPYVRIQLAGASKETHTIHASLNPIWYQPLTIHTMLPGNLDYAPKIAISVYDADPAPLNLNMLKEYTKEMTDKVIGRALAPSDRGSQKFTIQEYYNRRQDSIKPEWIALHEPKEANIDNAGSDDEDDDEVPPFGKLLCSFELRPHQPAGSGESSSSAAKKAAAAGGSSSEADGGDKDTAGSLRPPTETYLVEISVVGCRDMAPREILGVPVELQAPYVEFEYGDRYAEERVWRTRTAIANANPASSTATLTGPHVNLLETMYLRVEMPKDVKTFEPMMGVRVRESAKVRLPLGFGEDPIMGIASIDMLKEMPSYQEMKAKEDAERESVLLLEAAAKADEGNAVGDGAAEDMKFDSTPNETVGDEIHFTSSIRSATTTRSGALAKKDAPTPGVGVRTIADPETQELMGDDDEEEEGEEDEYDLQEPTISRPLEDTLTDLPFQLYPLSTKPPEPEDTAQQPGWMRALDSALPIRFESKKKTTGLLKMKVRVIPEEGSDDFLKLNPPQNLKKMYAERACKIRCHVYAAQGLAPRPNGSHPQPFLKVYNVPDRVRTTRDKAVPPSLDPDFYESFELSAMLPGQSRLHVEVWDYQLLSETMIGETIVDLEDRLFSKEWQAKQIDGSLPREIRALNHPGNAANQGFITVKVEIVERKYAIANPMLPIDPPSYDLFDLRIIIWDATDVKAKDESFFGGGGTSDVFITLKPIGREQYSEQKTDVHHRSPGDAEFNWRMVWPIALPEKAPRLFLQVWDADLLSANDAIGEAQLTLKPLCDKALRRGGNLKVENIIVPTTHPNFKGTQGNVKLTIELMPRAEALQKEVGLGRDAPNQFPYLATPVRPSMFDGLGINLNFLNPFYFFKKYAVCCCACLVIAAVLGVVIMLGR